MASSEHLKALLRSHIKGDDAHFLSVAMQLAAHEAKQGHGKLAEDLRAIIDSAKKNRLPRARRFRLASHEANWATCCLLFYPTLDLQR